MPLTVQLLPTSAGDASQLQPLTTFLVNATIAVDAGSLGFALPAPALARVGHVILTHAHMDHVASLPTVLAEVYPLLERPVRVYGTEPVIRAVREHLFNGVVWPDFAKIKMVGSDRPAVEWVTIRVREAIELDGVRFTAVAVKHEVPTVGLIAEAGGDAVMFTSDTTRTDEIWAEAGRRAGLRAVFVDCSFPDEFEDLAVRSGHLTPRMVAEESRKLGRAARVMCVHIKPGTREKTLPQIRAQAGLEVVEVGRVYTFDGSTGPR